MAMDFPPSPSVGDKFPVTPVAGQPQYTWDGEKWTTLGAQITTAQPATATPLMDQTAGAVGTAIKWAREDHVHPKIYAASFDALAFSGLQINGSMEVAQEKSQGTPVSSGYICDGWSIGASGTAGNINCYSQRLNAFPGLTSQLTMTCVVAKPTLAPGDFLAFTQVIEGYRVSRLAWGTANAQPLTIAFWSKHSRAGTYSVVLSNEDATRNYATTYTQNVADANEYKVITIPGCIDGVWKTDNTKGIYLNFTFACGTTNTAAVANVWGTAFCLAAPGQVNLLTTTADVGRLSGVVVLPGIEAPSAARSALVMRPYDQELQTCQRYFNTSYPPGTLPGAASISSYIVMLATSSTSLAASIPFPVSMCRPPTISMWSYNGTPNRWSDMSGINAGSAGTTNIGAALWGLINGAGVGLTMGTVYLCHYAADARL